MCRPSSAGLFTGPVLRATRTADFTPKPDKSKEWGELTLTVKLPLLHPNLREPLLVTGIPGKGDFVYLIGVDEHHLKVGYDHWGVSGAVSDLIEVSHDHPHAFQISLGSLFPALDDHRSGAKPNA